MTLKGELSIPGDKSISHRALILSSIASGKSRIKNILRSEDVVMTKEVMKSLGVEIIDDREELAVMGRGREGLKEPGDVLYAGNSGTTMRISSGLLASIEGLSVITGDRYLRKRPMDRIAVPLTLMGATVMGRYENRYPPLAIRGGGLRSIRYEMPHASAQVKSAILVAAATSHVPAEVKEPLPTRDHTERMLKTMGAEISSYEGWIKFQPVEKLNPVDICVPSDFSSAAFFIVGAIISSGSEIVIRNVLVNPLRCGLLHVLSRMGANIQMVNRHVISGEETSDIIIKTSELKGTVVDSTEIPLLIDEVPILAVAAAFASGITEIHGAQELRVKESDRIMAIVSQLSKLGVRVVELPDGIVVEGNSGSYKGSAVSSFGDHRIAMALEIFSLGAGVKISLDDTACVSTSFPEFYEKLRGLMV